jgi:hypothetical protein
VVKTRPPSDRLMPDATNDNSGFDLNLLRNFASAMSSVSMSAVMCARRSGQTPFGPIGGV